MIRNFLLFICFFIFSTALLAQQQKYAKIKINLTNQSLQAFFKLGFDYEGLEVKKDAYAIGIFSESEMHVLTQNNFEYKVLINDMTEFYKKRNQLSKNKNFALKRNKNAMHPTPEHFNLGTMGGFHTYNELLLEMDTMFQLFPNLITEKAIIDTGSTIEGRPVYFMKISDNPNIDENEPELLYSALTHAREPASMQHLLFYMYYLLENYGTNEEVTYLVDNLEMYFILCVNPDGYIYNETTDPNGGGLWRKNRRDNLDGQYGVDLNRNFGHEWGYDDNGSSPNTSMDTYRGTAPFSEPETQMVKRFTESRNFILALNYHTYSDLLVYPWGYEPDLYTPDSLIFENYAKLMTSHNDYLYGTPSQTVGYTGNGDANDWMYGDQISKPKIIAMTPEAGSLDDGFWPEISRIEDICAINVSMDLYMAHLALDYAIIKDKTPAFLANNTGKIAFDLQCLGMDTLSDFTVSLIPISSNISFTGNSKNFYNMSVLENQTDSIAYELANSINEGDSVLFAFEVDNGQYVYYDTILKYYGDLTTLYTDNCNDLSNWTSSDWQITSNAYYSSPSSITDSPNGNYGNSKNSSITLNQPINLSEASIAIVEFYTKWSEIEASYDYVQLSISNDNGNTWQPLTGTYTSIGSQNQDFGMPIYDGNQNEWVKEQIFINDYIDDDVLFKFELHSDWWTNGDGFYFDDFSVKKINKSNTDTTNIKNYSNNINISIYPNPANNFIYINNNNNRNTSTIDIYDVSGKCVLTEKTKQKQHKINISQLNNGVYYVQVIDKKGSTKTKKIVVLKSL